MKITAPNTDIGKYVKLELDPKKFPFSQSQHFILSRDFWGDYKNEKDYHGNYACFCCSSDAIDELMEEYWYRDIPWLDSYSFSTVIINEKKLDSVPKWCKITNPTMADKFIVRNALLKIDNINYGRELRITTKQNKNSQEYIRRLVNVEKRQ